MASLRWVGGAVAVAQVQTFALGGTWEVGDIIRVVAGSKKWDYAVTSTAIATFVPLFTAAYNALPATDYPEMAEMTASGATSLIFTGDTAGSPFTITLTPLESDGTPADAQTIEAAGVATTGTTATAATGPNHWSEARNWSTGATPATGDTVTLDYTADKIKFGLAQSGVTLAALYVTSSFANGAELGLPATNQDGTSYPEYRARYLTIGATLCVIGDGGGQGSGRVNLDFGTVQTACTVRATGTGVDLDLEAVQIKGTHANNALTVLSGEVAVAGLDNEASTVSALKVAGGTVRTGVGATLGTVTQTGGALTLYGAATTIVRTGGDTTLRGTGGYTTLTVDGGSLSYQSSGTIAKLNMQPGGTIDFGQDLRPRIATNADVFPGARILDPGSTVTWTNAIQEKGGADLSNWTFEAGPNRTVLVV